MRFITVVAVLLCLLHVRAHAQTSSAQIKATASQALFEEGRAMLQAGAIDSACAKFQESQRLEPALGTLLNLALCHEQQGKSASAWLEYNDALSQAARENDDERMAIAHARISAIESKLSRIALQALRYEGGWVELDHVRLSAEVWSTPIPADPGVHGLTFGAPGMREAEVQIEVLPAVSELQVPWPELTPVPPAPKSLASTAPVQPPPRLSQLHWVLFGSAVGLGVSGLALGSYFGLRAKADWDSRNRHCRSGCDAEAVAAGQAAQRASVVSTVGFSVGAAALGLAAALLLTAPHEQEPKPTQIRTEVGKNAISLLASGVF